MLRVVTKRSLRGADHLFRGVQPSVVCLSVIAKPRKGRPSQGIGPKRHRKKKGGSIGLGRKWPQTEYRTEEQGKWSSHDPNKNYYINEAKVGARLEERI